MVHLHTHEEKSVIRSKKEKYSNSDIRAIAYDMLNKNEDMSSHQESLTLDMKIKLLDFLINFSKYDHSKALKVMGKQVVLDESILKNRSEVLIIDKTGNLIRVNTIIYKGLRRYLMELDGQVLEYVCKELESHSWRNKVVIEHLYDMMDME